MRGLQFWWLTDWVTDWLSEWVTRRNLEMHSHLKSVLYYQNWLSTSDSPRIWLTVWAPRDARKVAMKAFCRNVTFWNWNCSRLGTTGSRLESKSIVTGKWKWEEMRCGHWAGQDWLVPEQNITGLLYILQKILLTDQTFGPMFSCLLLSNWQNKM